MPLPINIEDLLGAKTIESDRIEFKEGWNPDSIYRSICAFANDFDNIGGGYILIGIEEANGVANRPVKGLLPDQIATIQKQMIGFNNLIKPYYAPKLFIEQVDGKDIIVLWIPGGGERPYEVPENITAKHKTSNYFIRKYASSIEAKGTDKDELIALANQIPFDDRANQSASLNDIDLFILREYLGQTGSKLANMADSLSKAELLEQLNLITGAKERQYVRNVAFMLFSAQPEKFFPYTYIELVHFPKGAADRQFTEKQFRGPVQYQIRQALNYIKSSLLLEKVIKVPDRAEANRFWNYPFNALEEIVANCIYHRNYQEREPVKIRIEPEGITFTNMGGPDRAIRKDDFANGRAIPGRYRNRRLGDFLKELELTEGHATGFPVIWQAIKHNGSPDPVIDFDDERTWFRLFLPIHPEFKGMIPVEELKRDLDNINEELISIDERLDNLINTGTRGVDRGIAGGVDRGIAGDIVKNAARDVAIDIGIDATENINERQEEIMVYCYSPRTREEILLKIGLTKNEKNFNTYIAPLIRLGWVEMTIPNKPTSPKQKYRIGLKGEVLLELMKYYEYDKE